MPKTVNTTHVMTWNVLQGGGKRRLRILGQIAQSNATIVTHFHWNLICCTTNAA